MDLEAVEILLVEDNEFDKMLAINALKDSRLVNRIYVVEDGKKALEYVLNETEKNPEMILLDLKLPRVSGLEVLRKLKEAEKTKNIPIVVLTSSKEENDIIESYRWGVDGYIVKPVSFEKLANAVKKIGYHWLLLKSVPNELSP